MIFRNCKGCKIIEVDCENELDLDPFSLKFIHVAHSIPQVVLMVISTRYGRVVHREINLTPRLCLESKQMEAALRAVERAAFWLISEIQPIPWPSRDQNRCSKLVWGVFKGIDGRILVTIFASNVRRIQSICRAEKAGRSVCLLGRSLHRMVSNARECGYLRDIQEIYLVYLLM